MIRPTVLKQSPVVTLLSPSPSASRQAQEMLENVFGLEPHKSDWPLGLPKNTDALNNKFRSPLPLLQSNMTWDSVVSQCRHSGVLLHWLSLDGYHQDDRNDNWTNSVVSTTGTFSLLGITQGSSVQHARNVLSSNMPDSLLTLRWRYAFGWPMTSDVLLSRHRGLPVFNFQLPEEETNPNTNTHTASDRSDDNNIKIIDSQKQTDNNHQTVWKDGSLKEIAFTTYNDAVYENGDTVLSRLSSSSLSRPVTGLYEWPKIPHINNERDVSTAASPALHLRPVPAAQQDMKGNAQSVVLTFYCDNVEDRMVVPVEGLHYSRIGYTGQGRGQVRVQAPKVTSTTTNSNAAIVSLLAGLDVRWCESTKPTSVFNEAHEALLASSLTELQSTNVVQTGQDDQRIGTGDCWMEVRSMVKNPRGFMQTKKHRIATPPPSYPE